MNSKDVKETVSSLKRSKIGLDACPRCGSTNVSMYTLTGYISQNYYVCNNCGFENSIFLEVTKEDECTKTEEVSKKGELEESKEESKNTNRD